jgi:hypothetical protein
VTGAGDVFVLHPSVVVRWWLRHLRDADAAVRFLLEALASRRARVIILDGLQHRTLESLAADLSTVPLQPAVAEMLYDDVVAQIDLLTQPDIGHVMSAEPVARAGFILASSYGIPLFEAQTVALAAAIRLPLLVCDGDDFAALTSIAAERPALHLVWLPDLPA